ncbi:thermonuclease family protein [Floridanema evergladense]|uniref:Thermonuclease family protein n=1 Tax=Floridaenema evergladense BLCC-F167 TaxID=3153639 RepID=A0ABV4WNC6_9CYAN
MKKWINILPIAAVFAGYLFWHYQQPATTKPKLMFEQPGREAPSSETWQVTKVIDGATMLVRRDNQNQQVQLCGIAIPEVAPSGKPGQSFAQLSQAKLRSLVDAANGTVEVTPVKTDKEGHIIAEVFVRNGLGDIVFQEEMLKSGLVYHRQNAGCYNRLSFEEAQKLAIAAKAGMWNQPKSNKVKM